MLRSILCRVVKSVPNGVTVRGYKRWFSPYLKELKHRQNKLDKINAFDEIKPSRRSTYIEWNYDSELFAFWNRLNEPFSPELLKTAFDTQQHEFMVANGEELLRRCIWYFLSHNLNQAPVEFIDAIGNYLMTSENLARVGKGIGIYDLIVAEDYPYSEELIAQSFKAVISALDQSVNDKQRVFTFIKDFVLTHLCEKDIHEIWTVENPLDVLQSSLGPEEKIEERLCFSNGTNSVLASYQIGIYRCRDKKLLGIGWGESLDIAKDMAARDALLSLWSMQDYKNLFDFSIGVPDSLFEQNEQLSINKN